MYHGDLEENRMTRELLKELLECIQMGIFFNRVWLKKKKFNNRADRCLYCGSEITLARLSRLQCHFGIKRHLVKHENIWDVGIK